MTTTLVLLACLQWQYPDSAIPGWRLSRPEGRIEVREEGGTALLELMTLPNFESARAFLRAVVQTGQIEFRDGVVDESDLSAVARVRFDDEGLRREAICFVAVGPGGANVAALSDREGRLSRTYGTLTQLLRRAGGDGAAAAAPAAPRPLTPQSYAGGRISLPADWRITGTFDGGVSAEGPDGGVDLGLYCQVWDSRYDPGWVTPPISAPYSTPGQAIRDLMPYFGRMAEQTCGVGLRFVRLNEERPFNWPGGQGAVVDFEFDRVQNGQAVRCRAFANVFMSPNVDGTWTFIWSLVAAPADRFAQSIHTLAAIYQSWQVSQDVMAGRLRRANDSLQQAFEIYQEGMANTRGHQGHANADWSDYIRGNSLLQDQDTGAWGEVPTTEIDRIRDTLNNGEGRFRYNIINRHDLDQ